MTHPYGRKAEVTISETSQKVMERGGTPVTALHFRGRPYKIAERLVNFLIERNYCMPGDVLLWSVTYRRNERKPLGDGQKITINIEPGDENGNGSRQL